MGWLDRFPPATRQVLMVGVPAVAAFVVVAKLRKPAAAGTSAIATPSTDAIGVGQLSDFETSIADQVNQLAMLIAQQPAHPPVTPPHVPPPPHHPPPPHQPQLHESSVHGVFLAECVNLAQLTPNVVVGVTAEGNWSYGGNADQVRQIVTGQPSPPQPAWDFSGWSAEDAAWLRSRTEW
jgi:hypothetical protein